MKDWGKPAFAKDFPEDAELTALVDAFGRGDYRTVRDGAPRLASASTTDPAVKAAAELLLARTTPDPAAKLLFLLAAVLLVFLSAWWVTHDGPDGDHKPPPVLHP